jgi:hypothetical protein
MFGKDPNSGDLLSVVVYDDPGTNAGCSDGGVPRRGSESGFEHCIEVAGARAFGAGIGSVCFNSAVGAHGIRER